MRTFVFRTLVLSFFMVMVAHVSAQFKVTMADSSDPDIKFVSAINTEESTFLYVTKTAIEEGQTFTCGKLNATVGYKKYKMKNCYNIPRYMLTCQYS